MKSLSCSNGLQMLEIDLLSVKRGHVSAPAGYGKTQLIADSLMGNDANKPVLILTHTNAGVAALRKRLSVRGVPRNAYILQTLDGWALRLLKAYPQRSGIDTRRLTISNPGRDYPAIQGAARRLVASGDIDTIIQASYSHLIVDEYQDCSIAQHDMTVACAGLLPTVVLGDPMQSVFGFAGPRVDWTTLPYIFPETHALNTPWRWNNAGSPEIGRWLASARNSLCNGEPIYINNLPDGVKRSAIPPPNARIREEAKILRELGRHGQVLIIGPSTEEARRHEFARRNPGVTVVEPVELRRMMRFANQLDLQDPMSAVAESSRLAQDVMTKIMSVSDFRSRIERILQRGTSRFTLTEADRAALDLMSDPTYQAVSRLLHAFRDSAQTRIFRPTIYEATQNALSRVISRDHPDLISAAQAERDARRYHERTAGKMAVGSTLLLKGLEAESCMIMNAHTLDRYQLYVALTRGSRAIHIWSNSDTLQPGMNR
ncbi:UvrD-helicase domain-containing protein [Halomonas sp. M4R1S46]|uniref:UvrD-helicase domain-containing protein n=1 Tax=Halomonas sp. M4R1S46 TaxID=2982692 RepID=UPI0021E4DBB2|nr:UvrD-helicase domain-containing protein [Halomonas sp. M4R1S46]UYG09311.1 UvrD-helicase domain-containing protein [Halomonas sp. M4R1S46]